MSLTIKSTKSGKPCIEINQHKYRESHILKGGDVAWRCLGRTCSASVRTNAERTDVVSHNNVHTGSHPKTLRSLSIHSPRDCQCNYSSTPSSPLISQLYMTKPTTQNSWTQTDAPFLNDLVTKFQELKWLQSCLIDEIQDLKNQAEIKTKREDEIQVKSTAHIVETWDECEGTESPLVCNSFCQTDSTACRGCQDAAQKLKEVEETIKHFQDDLTHYRDKYSDLLKTHEQLIFQFASENKNDTSKVENVLEMSVATSTKQKKHKSHNLGGDVVVYQEETTQASTTKKNKKRKKRKKNNKTVTVDVANASIISQERSQERSGIVGKLYIIGDSHARNLYQPLSTKAQGFEEIFVCTNASAGSDYILKNAVELCKHLTKKDVVILIAGTNDLSDVTSRNRSPANMLCGKLARFIQHYDHTNWVVVTLPQRHDLPPKCLINTEIRRLNKIMTREYTRQDIPTIDTRLLNRSHFTRHGLHLNWLGKDFLCDGIVEACRNLHNGLHTGGPGRQEELLFETYTSSAESQGSTEWTDSGAGELSVKVATAWTSAAQAVVDPTSGQPARFLHSLHSPPSQNIVYPPHLPTCSPLDIFSVSEFPPLPEQVRGNVPCPSSPTGLSESASVSDGESTGGMLIPVRVGKRFLEEISHKGKFI